MYAAWAQLLGCEAAPPRRATPTEVLIPRFAPEWRSDGVQALQDAVVADGCDGVGHDDGARRPCLRPPRSPRLSSRRSERAQNPNSPCHARSASLLERYRCVPDGIQRPRARSPPGAHGAVPRAVRGRQLVHLLPHECDKRLHHAVGRTCVRGEKDACAFECIARLVAENGWYLSLYTDDEVVDEVQYWNGINTETRALAINATHLRGFVGGLDATIETKHVYVTAEEAANNFADGYYYSNDQKPLPRGDTLPFDVPAELYESLEMVVQLRLENIRFVAPAPNVSLSFPNLRELWMRNTRLTSIPFVNASVPSLMNMDFSMNEISEVQELYRSSELAFVNLSYNALTSIPPDFFPPSVWNIDLSSNPFTEIPAGTLHPELLVIVLSNMSLTEMPRDLVNMTNLQRLTVDDNDLRTIPDDSIAGAQLTLLHATNCSLTAIPPIAKSMNKLTNLYLDYNDLSGDQDFSVLPPSMKFLTMQYCKLAKLPKDLMKLENFTAILLAGNPQAMGDLANLSPTTLGVFISDNELEAIPAGLRTLPNLLTLEMSSNPVEKISPGDLPATLVDFVVSDATFRTLQPKTLPSTIGVLTITSSLLEEAPEDIRSLQDLTDLSVANCKLQALDVADGLPLLQNVYAKGNRIKRFGGSYPALVLLDLRNNTLDTFDVASAPNLTTLYLADNNLSSVPAAIFTLPQLQFLNLSGNPIRNFAPTAVQLDFLQKIPYLIMEQAMFATECSDADAARLAKFAVCKSALKSDESAAVAPTHNKGVSVGLILGNVGLGLVLIALGFVWWRRRKHQKTREKDLKSQTASLEEKLLDDSIWTDSELLQHRLDASLVTRTRLLGAGVSGEVWLASYRNEQVALKTLRHTDKIVVQQFVSEIKLVLAMSHPRIVETIGVVWTKESDLGLVSEYMAGGDLRSHLDRTPRPAEAGWTPHMLQLALEITEAVVYLHSLDPIVIHRDLKSRNVLLDGAYHAKVSDFGISRLLVDDETLTADVGTMRWMAPEVLGGERYDESADIYSLGVILCEIDTHKLPFDGATDETGAQLLSDSAIATRLLTGSLLCSVSGACPPQIRQLVEKCTTFDRPSRPTGLQVAYELRKLARVV